MKKINFIYEYREFKTYHQAPLVGVHMFQQIDDNPKQYIIAIVFHPTEYEAFRHSLVKFALDDVAIDYGDGRITFTAQKQNEN